MGRDRERVAEKRYICMEEYDALEVVKNAWDGKRGTRRRRHARRDTRPTAIFIPLHLRPSSNVCFPSLHQPSSYPSRHLHLSSPCSILNSSIHLLNYFLSCTFSPHLTRSVQIKLCYPLLFNSHFLVLIRKLLRSLSIPPSYFSFSLPYFPFTNTFHGFTLTVQPFSIPCPPFHHFPLSTSSSYNPFLLPSLSSLIRLVFAFISRRHEGLTQR